MVITSIIVTQIATRNKNANREITNDELTEIGIKPDFASISGAELEEIYQEEFYIAVQFRKWATNIIEEFTVKAFVMDDERLKFGSVFLLLYLSCQHHAYVVISKGSPFLWTPFLTCSNV